MPVRLKKLLVWGLLLPLPILLVLSVVLSFTSFIKTNQTYFKDAREVTEHIKADCLEKNKTVFRFHSPVYAHGVNGVESANFSSAECLISAVEAVAAISEPKIVLEGIEILAKETELPYIIDPHVLSHEVGEEIARRWGINADAFLKCTDHFDYGCYHGFFIYATAESVSIKEAADKTCGQARKRGIPPGGEWFCYHGVGHALMMTLAYDLEESLAVCDSFTNTRAQDACWQGVFMENMLAENKGETRDEYFTDEDLMAPCNKAEGKYKHQCYINHAGYLVNKEPKDSILGIVNHCKKADKAHIDDCVLGAGLMATTEAWQGTLKETRNLKGSVGEVGAKACNELSRELRFGCMHGGASNLTNNQPVEEAFAFCALMEEEFRDRCYWQVGLTLTENYTELVQLKELCRKAGEGFKECMQGAMVGL